MNLKMAEPFKLFDKPDDLSWWWQRAKLCSLLGSAIFKYERTVTRWALYSKLAYPKAALFSFALALVAYNLLATLRAALASVHGVGKIDASLSDFYLVDEIHSTYRGMMIAIPPTAWLYFGEMALTDFALLLQDLAHKVYLTRFLKQPRTSKKKKPLLVKDPKHPHVSTAKLLSGG